MAQSIDDELGGLKTLLKALESKEMKLIRNGTDVTKTEAQILRRDIAHLEKVLARTLRNENHQ